MKNYLFTKGGKFGDILWALPVIRAWSQMVGEPIDFTCMASMASLLPLIKAQPYIGSAFLSTEWTSDGTDWPKPMEGLFSEYKEVRHGNYRRFPDKYLTYFIADMAGLSDKVGYNQDPWIETDPDFEDCSDVITYSFNQMHAELKAQALDAVHKALPHYNFMDVTKLEWGWAANFIAKSKVYLGCRSSNYVLAHAVKHPNIVVFEPAPERTNEMFGCPFNTEWRIFNKNIDQLVDTVKGLTQ